MGFGVAGAPGLGADVFEIDREQCSICIERAESQVVVVEPHGSLAEAIAPTQQHIGAITGRHVEPVV